MGGLMILASIIITSLFYVKDYPRIIPILFMTVGFGVIGFLDDYLKVVLRRSDGLLPWQKMILQFVVTTVFAVYMVRYSGIELTMLIPFSGGKYLNIGWLAIPLLYFAVIGTVNGVNFTDGVDGLVSSVTIMVATFFSVVAIGTNAGIAPITVFYQIAVADGINALVLTKRKTIIAVIPICPQLHIFLIAERSVVVGVFAHEIAACLRSLQPLNALQGRLKLKFQICTH